jgi:hypothetical protein
MPSELSAINKLELKLGCEWTAIQRAQATTAEKRGTLQGAFHGRVSQDTSVVLFGSIGREEMTSGSDADWILLIDGQAAPEHDDQKRDAAQILAANEFGEPGKSGIFGCMVGSHSLVHEIGGEDDTNSNTTRRILLLLESFSVGDLAAYTRVRRQILNRYVLDDRGLLQGSGAIRIPRFLLNDLTRYWRTITVDFVYKQRADAGKKWALRNAKLRMSRKLVFASGLLRCFFCHLDPNASEAREELILKRDPSQLISYLESELMVTPLELLARAAAHPSVSSETCRRLFDSYDGFLGLLDNEDHRKALEGLRPDQLADSLVWGRVREFSRNFQSGLTTLFYRSDDKLRDLVIEYGVF